MKIWKACLTITVLTITVLISSAAVSGSHAHTRTAFSRALPHLDGSRLEARVVEVMYPPGGSSSPHSHPCTVIGFVTEGAYRTQVKGESESIYQAGQAFYEAPDGVHLVSANASDHEAVKFVAFFICDRETSLSVPVAGGTR